MSLPDLTGNAAYRTFVVQPCVGQIVLTRYSRVEPPSSTKTRPRHLIETVTWQSFVKDGLPARQLHWRVEEVKGEELALVALEDLVKESGSAWPTPDLPQELQDTVTFRMTQTGKVEYRIGGRFQVRGFLAE